MTGEIHHKSAIDLLTSLPDASIDVVYTDPPFGTNRTQTMTRKASGKIVSQLSYDDKHSDYLEFLERHVLQMNRLLKDAGTMYLHLDARWSHYAKVMCDGVFGRDNFLSEIIWSYNYGGRARDRFAAKHDNVLVYAKSVGRHVFNSEEIDRIPYVAPELQYVGRSREDAEARIARGQLPTDVWNMSIVGTASKERLGYPSQKPIKLVKRCIVASSPPGGIVLDPFAGSGTTGDAARSAGRSFILSDASGDAIDVMRKRFAGDSSVRFFA